MEAFGAGAAFLLLLWTLVCGVYAILIFFIPFILYGIMKNTKRTADLLTQMRSFQNSSPEAISRNIWDLLCQNSLLVHCRVKNH
jgi:hypothetical protein